MTVKVKKTYDLSKVARAKGRNYAEIDGIRIVFEDGKLEGWYDPGTEQLDSIRDLSNDNGFIVPSEQNGAALC